MLWIAEVAAASGLCEWSGGAGHLQLGVGAAEGLPGLVPGGQAPLRGVSRGAGGRRSWTSGSVTHSNAWRPQHLCGKYKINTEVTQLITVAICFNILKWKSAFSDSTFFCRVESMIPTLPTTCLMNWPERSWLTLMMWEHRTLLPMQSRYANTQFAL